MLDDDLHQALEELAPREGVEARDRLVEHEQLRSLRHRQGERKLGALTARELAGLLARVEPEALDAVLGELRVPARVHPRAEPQVIARSRTRRRSGCPGRRSRHGRAGRASCLGGHRGRRSTRRSAAGGRRRAGAAWSCRRRSGRRARRPCRRGWRACTPRAPTCVRSACRGRSPR